MNTRSIVAGCSMGILLSVSVVTLLGTHALQLQPHRLFSCSHHHHQRRPIMGFSSQMQIGQRYRPLSYASSNDNNNESTGEEEEDDETLLESIDPSTLENLCEQYALPTSGTKQEMLDRLREYANEQAQKDQQRRKGRTQRVEANFEGKARHTIMDNQDAFTTTQDEDEETEGYFYYPAPETEAEKKLKEEERRKRIKQRMEIARKESQSQITAPPPPEDVKPNEKGERVVTVYSTTEKNDLTGVTSQTPMQDGMSLENAQYAQKSIGSGDQPESSLIGGPFGDTSGSKRKKADSEQVEKAKEDIRELVSNLLATTGAPAFQDDFEEGDDIAPAASAFVSFTGFQAERIPPELLSRSSSVLRADGGNALKEILSEYELQAIGHDGMAADDISQGGGHYREVVKVASFLEGYRKAEERRVARETSTMLLDRLVKEGVKGLDQLLAGLVREGDAASYGSMQGDGGGELNGALVRYLEEAIREQEQRVKREVLSLKEKNNDSDGSSSSHELKSSSSGSQEDEVDLVWNVTRGDDGTIIETIDPNNPMVGQMLREELEKTREGAAFGNDDGQGDRLSSMTVQEKMLVLLKLLRDRVKVEAVVGNDKHARNLRILAYCLKAANDEERQQLIMEELGNSLDALDEFSDLITASIDYAEARSNDDEFMPGNARQQKISPVLNVSKLQKIEVVVERIKRNQSSKAAGASQ